VQKTPTGVGPIHLQFIYNVIPAKSGRRTAKNPIEGGVTEAENYIGVQNT
jgi:hypothetical protein